MTFSLWSRFFGRRTSYLDTLPEDILVDEIISHLTVKDILSLRRVRCLSFFPMFHLLIFPISSG